MFGIVLFCAIYIMTFLVSFGLSKYASYKLIAAVNGVLSAIGIAAVVLADNIIGGGTISRSSDMFLIFVVLYICIPNIIMYLILRRKRKEKYNFKAHLLKALIMTVIWFPFPYLALSYLVLLSLVVLY